MKKRTGHTAKNFYHTWQTQTIPKGWVQVTEGLCQPGDKFANRFTLKYQRVCKMNDVGVPAKHFIKLIRKAK